MSITKNWEKIIHDNGDIEYKPTNEYIAEATVNVPEPKEMPEISEEQIAIDMLNNLRYYRDQKLAETDWVVAKANERGEEVPEEWKTYRQALRDITNHYTSIYDVVFPEKPE